MSEFEGVDLEDTFILGWNHDREARELRFEVEASLWPGHPHYRQAELGEWTCYRRAALAFKETSGVSGLRSQSQVEADRDPDGSEDYGNFDALWRDERGSYHVAGRFGEAEVRCEQVVLRVAA